MPTKTNYAFEKRQRELEKKRKKEEKAKRKADDQGRPGEAEPTDASEAPQPPVAD